MKSCDLRTVYTGLASRIPSQADGNESITLSSHNLPSPPYETATDYLYISKLDHIYNDWYKVDPLHFFARKETYRHLGLLILSVVFHQRISKVVISLKHPCGGVKSLIVEYAHRKIDELPAGYHTRPFAFEYYPRLPDKHPFGGDISPEDLPCFELSYAKELNVTDPFGTRVAGGMRCAAIHSAMPA